MPSKTPLSFNTEFVAVAKFHLYLGFMVLKHRQFVACHLNVMCLWKNNILFIIIQIICSSSLIVKKMYIFQNQFLIYQEQGFSLTFCLRRFAHNPTWSESCENYLLIGQNKYL